MSKPQREKLLTNDLTSGFINTGFDNYKYPVGQSWSTGTELPLTSITTSASYYAASDTIAGNDIINQEQK